MIKLKVILFFLFSEALLASSCLPFTLFNFDKYPRIEPSSTGLKDFDPALEFRAMHKVVIYHPQTHHMSLGGNVFALDLATATQVQEKLLRGFPKTIPMI